jgi:hypothetical protein
MVASPVSRALLIGHCAMLQAGSQALQLRISGPARAILPFEYCLTMPPEPPATDHDPVAAPIEKVICRRALAMLRNNATGLSENDSADPSPLPRRLSARFVVEQAGIASGLEHLVSDRLAVAWQRTTRSC